MGLLEVKNNGQDILGTNFWETEHNHRGVFHLSLNAGAFRLLIPIQYNSFIKEFETAKEVIISRGKLKGQDALELLFDDGTDEPFAIHLNARQISLMPDSTWVGVRTFTAWIKGQGESPICAYKHDCHYRIVKQLPYLKPL